MEDKFAYLVVKLLSATKPRAKITSKDFGKTKK
jgi:hypothetical protein